MPTATRQNMATDMGSPTSPLKGTADNPAREPRRSILRGKGGMGDQAFMDAVALVIGAWVIVLLLMYSLRHHNI